jgi:hypothetical protein
MSLSTATQTPAMAEGILEDTFLLNFSIGSNRSDIIREFSVGGYELSDGTPVDFARWYSPRHPDLNLLFLTQINSRFGVTWGFSTGEFGEKYRIDPGLWIGFVYRADVGKQASLTLSALTMLGGDLREFACLGDYGEIGGIQSVNCRLAAGILPPEDTLNFLANEAGFVETRLSIRYELRF